MLHAAYVICPWCWQNIELTIDCSAGSAQIVEDCVVCCRPMSVNVHVGAPGELPEVEVTREAD